MSDDASELPGLPARAFAKIDTEPDDRFYDMPRFVAHIDDAAIAGVTAITFSNRCFPTKAVAIWQSIEMGEHPGLVSLYLQQAGFPSVEARTLIPLGGPCDPLWAVIGRKTA